METLNINLLEILGKSYVIDHCIAFFERKTKEQDYRDYIGNALYVIAHNTAAFAGGKEMATKYTDMYKPEDTRTAEEIKNSMKEKLAAFGKA